MNDEQIILVPVANPRTSETLIKLALMFASGEHSKVIALYVLLGNLDIESETLDALEPLVEKLRDEGHSIDLYTRKASNIARGILDAANEANATLVILGPKHRTRSHVVLGTIAENVLANAPCTVLIYSGIELSTQPKRIIVPVDGTPPARAACEIGWVLAQHHDIDLIAIHAQESYIPRWVGLGRIEVSLETLKQRDGIQRMLVTAGDPAAGILARLEDDDILVIGYSLVSLLERWLFGDFSRRILDEAQCPVILTVTASENGLTRPSFWRSLKRFQLKLTPAEQEDIQRQAYGLAALNLDYIVLIAIASMLAALGLLENSVAVIIGAMLVAPFMQPCIAFAIGLTGKQAPVMRRAFRTLLAGIPLALVVALICGLLVEDRFPTSEMLARGNWSHLDVMIAIASGMMGAYATARKDIPAALAGVAIAAALMPPLCTFGLSIASGYTALGVRAGLLFLTNIICIILAAAAVFLMIGLRPARGEED
ncbi:MAG: TIGR00341 family protein [Anaerolineae bacterium]